MLTVRSEKVVRDIPWRLLGGQDPGGAGLPGIPDRPWRLSWPESRPNGGTEWSDEGRHTLRTVRSGGQGRKMLMKT